MFAWEKCSTAELYVAIVQLEAEAAELTAAVGQSKRENGGVRPTLALLPRRNVVHEQLGEVEAEVHRRGE